MAGRKSLGHSADGISSARMSGGKCLRHTAEGARSTWMRACGATHPLAVRVAAGPSFHHPIVALPLQKIPHVHSGSGDVAAFRLKVHGGGGFILAVGDVGDADVH